MNRAAVDRIANAVLYEGYILYPYRPSVKNRQRWTFGGLYPEAYSAASGDPCSNQTECLIEGSPATVVTASVRFLHLTNRIVGELTAPWPAGAEPDFHPVEALRVGERIYHAWQEAEERAVVFAELPVAGLLHQPRTMPFTFPSRRWLEALPGPDGDIAGVLVREQQPIEGTVEATVAPVSDELFRLTLRVLNRTPFAQHGQASRDDALLRSLVSTHAVLGVRQGAFVSLLEPPAAWQEAAAACRNVGTWPVLVGDAGERDTMLSAPIILYDYPQVAPESPGDFFDGTEIDEMLTLRILTMTDDEKRLMAAVDERARALLTRTETLGAHQLLQLHGTVRGLRPVAEEGHD